MSLDICYGPMFAGKSTRTLNKLTTLADIGEKCLYINHGDDKRKTEGSDSNVTTHNSQFVKASPKIVTISASVLAKVKIEQYDAIGIDEGQFFTDIDVVRDWVLKDNKKVFISGLNGDASMGGFGEIWKLLPIASNIIMLKAYCVHCKKSGRKRRAPYTAKLVPDTKQKDVGGADKYIALCLKCHKKHTGKRLKKE